MANLFDSTNYPDIEPEILVVGDFWTWTRDDLVGDYDPSSYALSYSARLDGAGSTAISITASESSTSYYVEVASSTTASYTAGTYRWASFITRSSDSERVQIDEGIWTIETNKAASTADPRSHAKIMVDNLRDTLESLSTRLSSSYSIADRQNTLRSMRDIREQLRAVAPEYRTEIRKQRALNGQPTGANTLIKFGKLGTLGGTASRGYGVTN